MLSPRSASEPAIFHFVMIKPTHYDDAVRTRTDAHHEAAAVVEAAE
jgi:hypothetical protein